MSDIDPEKLEEAIDFYSYEASRITNPVNVARATLLVDAARAHLATLPRYKEVEVWRIEFALDGVPKCETYLTNSSANNRAEIIKQGHAFPNYAAACIRVTGPHKQRVPA